MARNPEKRAASKAAEYQRNKERYYASTRAYRNRVRQEVIEALGGQCVCCGEDHLAFLTIDHIHGLPDHHKRANGKRKTGVIWLVRREGCPRDKYQILCANCNHAKGIYGVCPHQEG